ncbi:c-type cytochrome [Histidinibacterium lentulum]|uniref:Cytochrome C n=1 Tax=Histidinibacterium lentulum TaxID=2480588 RepID=A0A3N2R6Z8_9RHOB|nr:c-type cytochrome [Histidinibacterium lentulum]ROU03106.1 cytochrome C [Histidinibacterium lentulum]
MNKFTLAAAAAMLAAPAFAQDMPAGDADAGAEQFERQCVACHVVETPDGETLAGRRANTGPNLYGVAMKQIASVEDFRYSASLSELGETGAVWNEENFVGYVQDPTGWLREALDDRRARGNMAYQVRSEEDAVNLYAYLYSLAPPEEGEAMEEEASDS